MAGKTKQYVIHPIALSIGTRDMSQWTYRMNAGVKCTTACYIWYIGGSQPRTLIDAGVRSDMFAPRGFTQTDRISAEDGLGRLGLKPKDIDIIIVTHLHWDHMALAYLYKNAKFIVQKSELEYARKPHPIDAPSYDRSFFDGLNIEVVEGEREIIPGVTVFHTPGHTPGGQSVAINTSGGKAIVTGFCATLATFTQNEEMKRKGWEVSAFLGHQDVRDAYDSVLRVKKMADIIIPLHDPSFIEREAIP